MITLFSNFTQNRSQYHGFLTGCFYKLLAISMKCKSMLKMWPSSRSVHDCNISLITMVMIYITKLHTLSYSVGSICIVLMKYDTVSVWLLLTASCNGVSPHYSTTIHTVMIWYNKHLNEYLHWHTQGITTVY